MWKGGLFTLIFYYYKMKNGETRKDRRKYSGENVHILRVVKPFDMI